MVVGRPRSDDSPQKYKDSYELYCLSVPSAGKKGNMIDEVSDFLEWAIKKNQPGFEVGDIVSIGGLASGVEKSRNTASKSVERLVENGMLLRSKPKSPYLIVSNTPIFKDTGLVADEKISLTIKMESESIFSEVRSFDLASEANGFSSLLAHELLASADPLISRAAQGAWQSGRVQYYQRIRTIEHEGQKVGYLSEVTFLRLSAEHETAFRKRIDMLRNQQVTQVSMYAVLEQCGLTDLRAGRTQVTVGAPPDFVYSGLQEFVDPANINFDFYSSGKPMLKWVYALFRPDKDPMVTFSVCFVRSDLPNIFIRSLDVELPPK